MLLSEYLSEIVKVIDEYSKTELVVDSDIGSDLRTPKIGIIKGSITFIDGSRLFFTEYVDARYKLEKLSYSFQYQSSKDDLIFRYDNAGHKPALPFAGHKHLNDGTTIEAGPPDFDAVLREIIDTFV